MQNTAANAPITFEEIVMVMINDKMVLLLGSTVFVFFNISWASAKV